MRNVTRVTINEFADQLQAYCEQDDFSTLQGFLQRLDEASFSDWQDYVNFDEASYKRNIIAQNRHFELTLICWRNGQQTVLHDHPSNGCLIKVMQGELFEERRCLENQLTSQTLSEGQAAYMCNAYGEHQMYNRSGGDTVSLHMYSPGLT